MRTSKRLLTALLAALILCTAAPLSAIAADDFAFGLYESNLQFGNPVPAGWWAGPAASFTIYLARNEREGLQAAFQEKSGTARNVRLEVSDFTKGTDILMPEVSLECFMPSMAGETADALVPYDGSDMTAPAGKYTVWYIELRTAKDTAPGTYTGSVTLYDADTDAVLTATTATAVVWDFALPEGHYSHTAFGNYDGAGGYGDRFWLMKWQGIESMDDPAVKTVAKAWYDLLLDHGINGYELPYKLIDDDPLAAMEYMTDPRVTNFGVPFNVTDLQTYKPIVTQNALWTAKAYVHFDDEPGSDAVRFPDKQATLETAGWTDIHKAVPFGTVTASAIAAYTAVFEEYGIDILVPNNGVYATEATYAPMIALADNTIAAGGQVWSYLYEAPTPAFDLFVSQPAGNVGSFRRAAFWEQYEKGYNGVLEWTTAYWRENPWTLSNPMGAAGVATGNGDGRLIYPRRNDSESVTTLYPSLRLKQIADGIEDFDYLMLAEEEMGRDFALNAMHSTGVLQPNVDAPWETIRNYDYWPNNRGAGFWFKLGFNQNAPNNMRSLIANALIGKDLHDFGAWETVILATDTARGTELRTCADCGTQESRRITPHTHDYSNLTQTIAPTHLTEGYSVYTCTSCEATEKRDVTQPTAHNYGDWVVTTPPTHAAEGEETRTCPADGATETRPVDRLTAHTYDSGIVTTDPTCTAPGVRTYTCTVDGDNYTEEIPMLRHDYGDWVVTSAATHAAAGLKERVCAHDAAHIETEVIPRLEAHTYGAWQTRTAATCTAAGVEYRACPVDNAEETRPINALGHDYSVFVQTVVPTVSAGGYTLYKCSRCTATEQRNPTSADSLSGLSARISQVQSTTQTTGSGKYTDASWSAFQTALTGAQQTVANANATQAQVTAALNALNTAYANLSYERGIFGTAPKWYGEWWHYLLFFLCFGFIWMWF
ncbi:MAG: DUF4091 domain-containing protein [Oscillospiraceae bacterium]|jgi:hypothetical protein|nr:DUF4091 domain-containing protein [Oscillospiraceae bacterium]